MKQRFCLFSCLFMVFFSQLVESQTISLAGEWQFREDPNDRGVIEQWYNASLTDCVTLPGSMNTNGKGNIVTAETQWTGSMNNRVWYESSDYERYRNPDSTKIAFWLTPDKEYVGVAWYQKRITIPSEWEGRSVFLSMERCHWETSLWVDGKAIGMRNSLSIPHRYALEGLKGGDHTLVVRVDNRIKEINPGVDAHSISDNTQSNWNGIVGSIELQARSKVYINSVRIVPQLNTKQVEAHIEINNSDTKDVKTSISIQASLVNVGDKSLPRKKYKYTLKKGMNSVRIPYSMGENPRLWDEFNPNLYSLNVKLECKSGTDDVNQPFGMRQLTTEGSQIVLNGRPLFLRGTLECCIFPETGYPPTDEASWERIIKICRSYGLNHIRFHSWCPPKAAFSVADRLGFYLYIECGAWSRNIGSGEPIDQFVYEESDRIVAEYGNHPSFCFFSYGNEPGGENHVKYLTDFVKYWKMKDSRFLVTAASGWPAIPESDFLCVDNPRIQRWGEGVSSIINSQPPGSNYDWSERISTAQPSVSHEIGQWCVYPDLKERSQYTGVLKAKNFDIFEDRLREHDLLHLADSFLLASGRLQTLCYKADIEAALRTKGFGGFELLDLHDFPGQGTALVGVLNPFWRSKGYVTPEEYRQFCNEVVPLARMKNFIFKSGDKLKASVEIAQYSAADLINAQTSWKLLRPDGSVAERGIFVSEVIPTGILTKVGEIDQTITVNAPTQFVLELSIGGYTNKWNIWVYPNKTELNEDVRVVSTLDEKTIELLHKGGKVLLTPSFGALESQDKDSVVVAFSSIFWNTMWTKNQPPHTLGILCDPKHPALSQFPTDYYSDYQWQYAMSHCTPIRLDKLGFQLSPIVRIIDDWFTARPLGMIVEMKVGPGKLLICGADLLSLSDNRPEVRQLLNSLLNYMKSPAFIPQQSVSIDNLKQMFNSKI